jgi:hypothetical protein
MGPKVKVSYAIRECKFALNYLLAKVVLHSLSQHLLTDILCDHGRHDCGIVGGIDDVECVGKCPLIAGRVARTQNQNSGGWR